MDPIFWNFHIYQSHDVTVDGTYIWGDPRVPNNDGIDIDSSQNVIVRNVNVSTCDDAICFKANDGVPLSLFGNLSTVNVPATASDLVVPCSKHADQEHPHRELLCHVPCVRLQAGQ